MKTDELIEMLGANVEPVKSGQLAKLLLLALAIGAIAALCLMLTVLGLPAGGIGSGSIGLKSVALAFSLGLAAAGTTYLARAVQPVSPGRTSLTIVALLFLVLVVAGLAGLLLAHPTQWTGMIFVPQWAACLFCIPLFALVPFASLIWALRQGAPLDLTLTGAMAGLVAGALGAAAFALHHPGGSIPFIALWYGGAIVVCALAGAILGPRLLRW